MSPVPPMPQVPPVPEPRVVHPLVLGTTEKKAYEKDFSFVVRKVQPVAVVEEVTPNPKSASVDSEESVKTVPSSNPNQEELPLDGSQDETQADSISAQTAAALSQVVETPLPPSTSKKTTAPGASKLTVVPVVPSVPKT